jgi:hypothetical protein
MNDFLAALRKVQSSDAMMLSKGQEEKPPGLRSK